MTTLTEREQKYALRRETAAWQWAAAGLFALSLACNAGLYGLLGQESARHNQESDKLRQQLQHTEAVRDQALRELGAVSQAVAREEQARTELAEAYGAVGAWEYIGECTVTAYCPCEECCGQWADGLTAAGLPAGPGIVAVDESVIPLGSTVVIDGQKYLAADTGVSGLHVDICVDSHEEAAAFGVQTAGVWTEVQP